jgi:hypothetical protein
MTVNVTLTFPEPVLEWIDMERGEIKRSTYVIRLLRLTHENKMEKPLATTKAGHRSLPKAQAKVTVPIKLPIKEVVKPNV